MGEKMTAVTFNLHGDGLANACSEKDGELGIFKMAKFIIKIGSVTLDFTKVAEGKMSMDLSPSDYSLVRQNIETAAKR